MAHIQIRNVPPEVHRKLKDRAAKAGMSLSEYLRADLTERATIPTPEEFEERLRKLPPVLTKTSPDELIRRERDAR